LAPFPWSFLLFPATVDMLSEFIGQVVIIDLKSPFVCLGKLDSFDEHFLSVRNADLHDLRDTDTSRENYVAASQATGVYRNRKRVLICRSDIVAIARLEDVVDG
jgi:small nuclear ribonucleoprotein (snRNP)-like protein